MTNINRDFIIEYIEGIIPRRTSCFQEMEDYARENHIPIIETEVAQLLTVLMKIKRPKRILEIGTAIGYSSLIMCDALEGDCKITTIERNEELAGLAVENIESMGYGAKIEVLVGEGEEIIENLSDQYDLIFIDAAKGHYKSFFDKSIGLLSKEGLVISDNVLFQGMIANDDLVERRKKTIVKRLRSYLQYINSLDDYTSSIIPIGDGLAITYKEV